MGKATALFQKMKKTWTSKSITTKIRLFNTIILLMAMYGCKSWRYTKKMTRKLSTFQQRCLQNIIGISYREHIPNEEVLVRSNSRCLSNSHRPENALCRPHPKTTRQSTCKNSIEMDLKRRKKKTGKTEENMEIHL